VGFPERAMDVFDFRGRVGDEVAVVGDHGAASAHFVVGVESEAGIAHEEHAAEATRKRGLGVSLSVGGEGRDGGGGDGFDGGGGGGDG